MAVESISAWLAGLREGEPSAAKRLWEQYFSRLVQLARDRLRTFPRRAADEEDVALSVFDSFCAGVAEGRFPQLEDDHDLWPLLVVITERKAWRQIERERRLKRGGGQIRGDSVFAHQSPSHVGFDAVPTDQPTPEFALLLAEEVDQLLNSLQDETSRQVVLLKMQGFALSEIADEVNCSTRTVKRKLRLIRDTLSLESAE